MKLLIYLIIIFVGYKLMKKALGGSPAAKGHYKTTDLKGEDMVRDPSCNTYIPKDNALSAKAGGEVHYFCSEECRTVFKEKHS
jgi:YHS domain-containing protein